MPAAAFAAGDEAPTCCVRSSRRHSPPRSDGPLSRLGHFAIATDRRRHPALHASRPPQRRAGCQWRRSRSAQRRLPLGCPPARWRPQLRRWCPSSRTPTLSTGVKVIRRRLMGTGASPYTRAEMRGAHTNSVHDRRRLSRSSNDFGGGNRQQARAFSRLKIRWSKLT